MDYPMLINGKLVPGHRTLDVIDPSTGDVFATAACAAREDVNAAVEAAARAFPAWAATPLAERQAILVRMADAVDANADSLARLLTSEQGKPLGDARGEVGGVSYFLRHYAGCALPVEVLEDSATHRIELHRKPLGVVAAIVRGISRCPPPRSSSARRC